MWVRVDVWLEGFMSRVLWVLGGLQMYSGWSASGREATTGTQGFCVRNKENTTDAHVFLKETRAARIESYEAFEANVWKAGRRSLYTGVPW